MSYGVLAYAVKLEQIKALLGSGNQPELAALLGHYTSDLSRLDQMISDSGDEDFVPAAEILSRMIMEPELPADLEGINRAKAWYSFEYLCRFYGDSLPNANWYPIPDDWFDMVQSALTEQGINLKVDLLMYLGKPLALPRAEDWPSVGSRSAGECQQAVQAMRDLQPEQLADEDVRFSVQELQGWFGRCAELGADLVLFYY